MYLTKRQKEILDYIGGYLQDHGYAPTLEEIGAHFGLSSPATVYKHVQQLARKGYIRKAKHQGRGIQLVDTKSPPGVEVPVLGEIAGGRPLEPIRPAESVTLPPSFAAGGPLYVLRVKGNSLADELLLDGDLLVMEDRSIAADGDTVVLVLGDQLAALGRFFQEPGHVRLEPSHGAGEALYLSESQVRVRGVVVGLLRHYRSSSVVQRPRYVAAAR
jgi:repressor LexA